LHEVVALVIDKGVAKTNCRVVYEFDNMEFFFFEMLVEDVGAVFADEIKSADKRGGVKCVF